MSEHKIDVMWDDTPVDVSTEVNFIWSIANKLRGTYLRVSKGDSSRIIVSSDWDENEPCVTEVEECGYNCKAPIKKLRNDRSKLHDAVEAEDFVYYREYKEVKRILADMQKKLNRTMNSSVFDALF